jgi:Flp pilus assembly protein TadD
MGFLKKIKFWKKKNTNKPTKVDACVSTEDPRICDAATVSMDPTVMFVVYTQTEETRMDGGGATAAKQVYERQPEMNTQKIRALEEELVVSKRFTADLMLQHEQRRTTGKEIRGGSRHHVVGRL